MLILSMYFPIVARTVNWRALRTRDNHAKSLLPYSSDFEANCVSLLNSAWILQHLSWSLALVSLIYISLFLFLIYLSISFSLSPIFTFSVSFCISISFSLSSSLSLSGIQIDFLSLAWYVSFKMRTILSPNILQNDSITWSSRLSLRTMVCQSIGLLHLRITKRLHKKEQTITNSK